MLRPRWTLALAALSLACGSPPPTDAGVDASAAPTTSAVAFDLDDAGRTQDTFFDFPFPSDLRLRPDGTPDLTGYPNPRVGTIDDLLTVAEDRPGWPTVPVGYFRFGAPVGPVDTSTPFAAELASPILLLDVDPDSPERGRLFSTIAVTLAPDGYTGANLLAVASFPGVVLSPDRTYAFVVRRSLGDADSRPLDIAEPFAQLARGETPAAPLGARAAALYAPLFETLDTLGVARGEIAAATVFTTGDVVMQTRALTDAVLDAHSVTVDSLALDPTDGATHERYCELIGTVDMPQFQRGTPPFDTDGLFDIGADGLPVEQRSATIPVSLTLPKTPMPADEQKRRSIRHPLKLTATRHHSGATGTSSPGPSP